MKRMGISVPLFKKRIDPLSATVSLIQAVAEDDHAAAEQAMLDIDKLSTKEVFYGLFQFGQTFAGGFTPEHREMMKEELAKIGGPPELQTARVNIGLAVLYKPVQSVFGEAVASSTSGPNAIPAELLRQVAVEIARAAGGFCSRIDIKFRWK